MNDTQIWPTEPRMYIDETLPQRTRRASYGACHAGVMAALGAYAITGQIIPGIW